MLNTLIVEDEELIRRGLIESIHWNELGLRLVAEASNGNVALQILRTHLIDLVITDMRMPVCDGEELLRAMENEGYNCEIIVLSEYSDFSYMRQALHAHVFDYLLKPIAPEVLNQMLSKAAKHFNQKRIHQPESSDLLTKLLYQAIENQSTSLLPTWPEEWTNHLFLLSVIALPNPPENNEPLRKIVCPYPCAMAVCPTHRDLFGLLILLPDSASATSAARKWIEQLPGSLSECERTHCRIGIAKEVDSPSLTKSAYQEAVTALQFLRRDGCAITAYEQIERLPFLDNTLSMTEQQLDDLLKSPDGGAKLHQTLSRCLFPKEFATLSSVKRILVQFCFLLDRCFQKADGIKSIGALLKDDPMSLINQVCSFGDINELLDRLIHLSVANYSAPQELSTDNVVHIILEKMKTNYMDDLSLMNYANRFHINYIYLSRKFKEIAGKTFSDLLVQIRMEHASVLIEHEGYTEKETASLVGYTNVYYFTSSYKKYMERANS